MQRIIKILILLSISHLPLLKAQEAKHINNYYREAEQAYAKHHWTQADSLATLYCKVCQTELQSKLQTYPYSRMLDLRAHCAAQTLNYDAAIDLQTQAVEVRRKATDCEEQHLAAAINELALFYSYKGQYDQAIQQAEEALKIFSNSNGQKSQFYAVALSNMASFLSMRGDVGDSQRAVKLGEEAVKHIPKGTLNYANALNSLVVYYSQTGSIVKADEYGKRAIKVGQKLFGEVSTDNATMLSNLAVRLANVRNYAKALEYADLSRSIYQRMKYTHHLGYIRLLGNMASFNVQLDKFDESAALLNEQLPLLRELVGEAHPDYVRCKSELSTVYSRMGNYEKAEEVGHLEQQVTDSTILTNLRYGQAMSREASTLALSGNFERAIQMEQQALKVFTNRSDTLFMGNSLGQLSAYYAGQKQYSKAIEQGKAAVSLLEKKSMSTYCAQAYNTLSIAYYYVQKYDSAYVYGNKAVDTYIALNEKTSSVYAKTLGNLALYCSLKGDIDQAVRYAEEAQRTLQQALGELHPDNASLYYNVASFYNLKGNQPDEVGSNYSRALQLQTNLIRKTFSHQTAVERERFWNTKSYLYRVAPTFAFMNESNEQLVVDAYNAKLFTTGLLLNSEVNFRKLLLQVNDSVMLDKYNRLDLLRKEIDACYQLPIAEREERLKLAEPEAEALEKQLVKGCKEYGDFMSNLNVDCATVAQQLKAQDVAIEFVNFEIEGKGTAYAALILRRGWAAPRMRLLFTQADLDTLSYPHGNFTDALRSQRDINVIYADTLLTRMVWQPILQECEDVRNIYFSPCGMLYQLGIEYLPLTDSLCMADRYNCYRLSSTATAGLHRESRPIQQAAVFGGIDYETDLNTLQALHNTREWEQEMRFAITDADDEDLALATPADSLLTRAGFAYLPGTKAEADAIGEILMQNGIPTLMREGEAATEESFKALGGKDFSLIHIATHGFYFTPDDVRRSSTARAILQESGADDQSMNYAGLLLSGAQTALQTKGFPRTIENGILTAREISLLDFRKLDLVVLSACKTGVGEVKDDGVFGLQRAFKKAGAKSLVMSLWSVNDAATERMMTAFYNYLAEGMPKHMAFRRAQNELRRTHEFASPSCWAAFIMLDSQD